VKSAEGWDHLFYKIDIIKSGRANFIDVVIINSLLGSEILRLAVQRDILKMQW
jgi:hypothetical protein